MDGGATDADHAGHADHADHAARFRDRFWLTLVLAVPVVFWDPMIEGWFGYTAPEFAGDTWIAPVLGSVIYFWGDWPFLAGAASEIGERQPGMMLLIDMAITVAYTASMATSLGFFDAEVWWELALLIAVMLLGHWVEMRAISQTRGALSALARMMPDEAERVRDDGSIETIGVDEVVTGESTPVHREHGDQVVAGTVVADSSLRIAVDAVGDDTTLAGIRRMVEEAQQSTSRAQRLADRAAALLFYVAVTAAATTAVVWWLTDDRAFALNRSVTVLIIACPHALGLAIPLVTSISTSKSAKSGILVKDRLALEAMRDIDTVLFDKTGTLTLGEHEVSDIAAAEGVDVAEVLGLAGAVESDSEHPLARAIHDRALDELGELPRPATSSR